MLEKSTLNVAPDGSEAALPDKAFELPHPEPASAQLQIYKRLFKSQTRQTRPAEIEPSMHSSPEGFARQECSDSATMTEASHAPRLHQAFPQARALALHNDSMHMTCNNRMQRA